MATRLLLRQRTQPHRGRGVYTSIVVCVCVCVCMCVCVKIIRIFRCAHERHRGINVCNKKMHFKFLNKNVTSENCVDQKEVCGIYTLLFIVWEQIWFLFGFFCVLLFSLSLIIIQKTDWNKVGLNLLSDDLVILCLLSKVKWRHLDFFFFNRISSTNNV